TFDVEEQGIYGAQHYVDEAVAGGDSIMVMYNMDMIGHYENDAEAWVEPDPQVAYGELWIHYADSLCGITATPDLQSAGDYYYFRQAGYNVCAMQEKIFSTHYHSPSDSTTYINMDYLTRMITTTMASIYTIAVSLPPVSTTWVQNVGDGQSVRVNWEPIDMSVADHYCIYYSPTGMPGADSVVVSADSASYIVDGLTQDWEYRFRVVATDTYGTSSIASAVARCVPSQLPALPPEQHALPIYNGVKLYWAANDELDFDHYGIVRDGQMVAKPHYDSVYYDTDPSLGMDFHDYLAVAFDADGHMCDTVGASTVSMRIATLADQKILALNRSSSQDGYHAIMPDSTGAFMVEALDGLDFTYAADTAFRPKTTCLLDLVDYGLVVVGAESARWDDIADYWSGFLDTLEYYLSIGGKAIVFGRWGDISLDVYPPEADTVWYESSAYAHGWTADFNIAYRVRPMTTTTGNWTLISDFIGGHTQSADYPELVWDSLATAGNTPAPYVILAGVPAASYPSFVTPEDVEILYTYNSSTDWYLSEGQPVAWRYVGGVYDYIHFDIPLSFMERSPAITALRQAAEDLGIILPEHCCTGIRGNANGDLEDKANISDVTYLIAYLFGIPGGPPPDCTQEGNANGDLEEKVNISDITYLVAWLFGIPCGPEPPACP
ncbi:MAG: M28 family peptidase, partial [candidate division Zixibacteria bacterium]|nr:M28 family peptidase [candidate division Zixibacteria bacterium]